MDSRQEIIYDIQTLGESSLDELLSKARAFSLEIKRGQEQLRVFESELAILKESGKSTAAALAKIALNPSEFKTSAKVAQDVIRGILADLKDAAKEEEGIARDLATAKLRIEQDADGKRKAFQREQLERQISYAKEIERQATDAAAISEGMRVITPAAALTARMQPTQDERAIRRFMADWDQAIKEDNRRTIEAERNARLRAAAYEEEARRIAAIRQPIPGGPPLPPGPGIAGSLPAAPETGLATTRPGGPVGPAIDMSKGADGAYSYTNTYFRMGNGAGAGGGTGGGGTAAPPPPGGGNPFASFGPNGAAGSFLRGASGLGFFGNPYYFAGVITREVVERMAQFVEEEARAAKEAENLGVRLGITGADAQKLSAAAELAGVNIKGVENGSRALANALEEPTATGKQAALALDKLGVATYDVTGKAREIGPVFKDALAALAKIPSTAERLDLANKLFPRGAAKELEPLIANLDSLNAAVARLGIGKQDQINALSAEFAKLQELHLAWDQLKRDFATDLAPVVTVTVNVIRNLIERGQERKDVEDELTEFRKENNHKFVTAQRLDDFTAKKVIGGTLATRNAEATKRLTTDTDATAGAAAAKRYLDQRKATGDVEARIEALDEEKSDLASKRKIALTDLERGANPAHPQIGSEGVEALKKTVSDADVRLQQIKNELAGLRKQGSGAYHTDEYAKQLADILEQPALRTPTEVADVEAKHKIETLVESFRREHKGAQPPAADLDKANAALIPLREVAEDKEHDQDVKREGIESEFEKIAPGLERQSFNKDRDFQFREALIQGKRDLDEQQRIRQEALRAQFDTGQEEAQLNRGRARITQIQAGPADQGRAAIQNFNLRAREIEQEHQYELAVVKTMDAEKQKAAAEEANHKARTAQLENEIDLQVKLAEAQKQREDKIRTNAEGAFRALISKDGGGIGDFFKAQALGMATTVAGNVGVELMKNVHANLPDSVLKGADGKANVLGRVLEGTPFGINHENEIKEAQAKLKDSNLLLKASVDANTKALGGEAPAGGDADLGDRTAHTATNALHKATGIWDELKHLFHKPKPAPPPTITEPELPAPSAPSIPADISPDLGDAGDSHASMGASLDALTAIIGGTPPSGGSAAFNGDPDSLIGILRRPAPGQPTAQPNPFSPFGPSETIRENSSVAPLSFDLGSLFEPPAVATTAPATSVLQQSSPAASVASSALKVFRDAFHSDSSSVEKSNSSVESNTSSSSSVENNTSSTAPNASSTAQPVLFDQPDKQSSPAARISNSILKVFRDAFHSSDSHSSDSSIEKNNSSVEKSTTASSSVEKNTSLPNVESGSGAEGSDAATLGGLMAAVQPNAAGNPAALLPQAPGASRSPISAIASAVPIVRDILGLFHSPGMPAPGRQPQDRHGFPTGGRPPATPSAARIPGAPDPAIKSIADKLSAERDNTHALADNTKSLGGLSADIKKLDAEIARLIAQEAQCGCGGSKQQQSSTGGLGGVLGSLGGILGGLGGAGGGAESGISSVISGAFGSDGTPILEELGGSQGIGGGLASLLGGGGSGGSGGLSSLIGSLGGKAPAFTGPNDTFGGLTGEDLGNLGDFNPSELGQLDNSAAGTAPDLGMDSIVGKLAGAGGKGYLGKIGGLGGILGAAGGAFQAFEGFKQGGAKGTASGVGGVLTTAAALDPEPISKIALMVGAGISDLVSAFMGSSLEERKKSLTNEIDSQYKYVPPAQKDYYFSMEGGGSDKGIGGVARTGGQTVLQTVNINTMDTIGFKDFLQRNTNAFAGAMNYALTNSGNQTLNQTLSKVVSTTPR